jgi:hypothetical protein
VRVLTRCRETGGPSRRIDPAIGACHPFNGDDGVIAMLVRRRGILRRHYIQPRRFRMQLGDQVCGVDLGNKYRLWRPAYSKGHT